MNQKINLATKITFARIFLVPIFLVFILIDKWETRLLALLIFILGAITDIIDGVIARKKEIVTNFGSNLDPLADKLLITTAFICLLGFKELKIPSWTVVVIILRDYIITWLRSMVYNKTSIPADKFAKLKTFLQNVAVVSILLCLIFKNQILKLNNGKYLLETFPRVAMIIVALFTLFSGLLYIIKYRKLLLEI